MVSSYVNTARVTRKAPVLYRYSFVLNLNKLNSAQIISLLTFASLNFMPTVTNQLSDGLEGHEDIAHLVEQLPRRGTLLTQGVCRLDHLPPI